MKPSSHYFEEGCGIWVSNNPEELMHDLYESARSGTGDILEIGTHKGGSALVMMAGIADRAGEFDRGRLVTVDPYGNRPYPNSGSRYGDADEREAMCRLANASRDLDVAWNHFRMESLEFFLTAQFAGYWDDGKRFNYSYSTVFLDGEHVFDGTALELLLCWPYCMKECTVFVDDLQHNGQYPDALMAVGERLFEYCEIKEPKHDRGKRKCMILRTSKQGGQRHVR